MKRTSIFARRHFLNVGASFATSSLLYPTFVSARSQCEKTESFARCRELYGGSLCMQPAERVASEHYHAAPPPPIKLPWKDKHKSALPNSSTEGLDQALRAGVLEPLSRLLSVNPMFAYYDETLFNEGPNAIASPDASMHGHQGAILFGLNLLKNMLAERDGDYALMAICAHEFGHIKQYEMGAQLQIAEKLPCYCIELHADFLAGFFIRKLHTSFGTPNFASIGRAWDGWDKQSCTHGSREQRVEALEVGFLYADPGRDRSATDAVVAGVEYLRKHA